MFGIEIEKANFLLTKAMMFYILLEDFAVNKFAYSTNIDSLWNTQPNDKNIVWNAFELEEDITI